MQCDHTACENEARWEITRRDPHGKFLPKKIHFCSFCMMRVINRLGYRTAVIERIEDDNPE